MEGAPSQEMSDAQAVTLTSTIKELVEVVRELKNEVASQKQELKDLREQKKKPKKRARFFLDDVDDFPASLPDFNLLSDLGIACRTSNADQKFHLFPMLPPELRMRIWKLALPSGRLFEPYFDPPHRNTAGPGGFSNVTFTIGAAGVNVVQGGANANANANPNAAPQVIPTPRPDPPPVRLGSVYPAPKIRMACREARRAASEAGSFEFGIFGTQRRGYWFNQTTDVVKIASDILAQGNFRCLDLSRVQRIAFSHIQFKTEQNCIAVLDLILATASRCRAVILFYDQDARFTYRHPSTSSKSHSHPLKDDDVIGNHAFPASRGLPDGPVQWGDLHRVVISVWEDYMTSRGLDRNRLPQFVGMDLIRTSRLY